MKIIMAKSRFNPQRFSGLNLWLSASDYNSITLSYNAIAETASGTSGTNTITASANVAAKIFAGNKIKVGVTDIYTVASVSTVTITTVEILTTTYGALTVIAVGQVSQWNDKSGLSNHVTQGTVTAQPTYASNILNGGAVLTFDGGDTLVLPSALYAIANGNNTIFAVAKRNTEAGASNKIFGISEGGSQRLMLDFGSSTGSTAYQSRNISGAGVSATGTNTNYQIFSGFRSGTTQSLSINGGIAGTNTNGADESGCDAGYIGSLAGSSAFLTGGIAEILLYNRALAISEISRINRYLANKFAITIS